MSEGDAHSTATSSCEGRAETGWSQGWEMHWRMGVCPVAKFSAYDIKSKKAHGHVLKTVPNCNNNYINS